MINLAGRTDGGSNMTVYPEDDHPVIRALLEPGEQVEHRARALEGTVALTDRRLAVVDDERVALAVPVQDIRRLQFDIEKARPATLVIVPERPTDLPQSLSIAPEHYAETATLLVTIGHRLMAPGASRPPA
jgi:hypothetical protein